MMELYKENREKTGQRVELLAPAGNYEAFLGAVNAGADAVYLGGEKFGARAYADNFTTEDICRAIHVAHFMGRKIYLTVNTLLKEDEFAELIPYLQPFYEAGLDGVIVQDIGVLTLIRNCFPELALHASTQMTLTGPEGCAFLQELGVERIVPARELSLDRVLYPRGHVLLLFGTVPFQQYAGRQERQQGTLCPALPAALSDLRQCRQAAGCRCGISFKSKGHVYDHLPAAADRSRH